MTDAQPSPGMLGRVLIAYSGIYRFESPALVTHAKAAARPDLVTQQLRSVRFESPSHRVMSPENNVLGEGQVIGLSIVWKRLKERASWTAPSASLSI